MDKYICVKDFTILTIIIILEYMFLDLYEQQRNY